MSINFCHECYDIPGLADSYPFLNERDKFGNPKYRIYRVDPEDLNPYFPLVDNILAATDFENIYVRRDLKGKTAYLHILKEVETENGYAIIEEVFPLNAFDFSLFHEAEHIDEVLEGNPYASEKEVNMDAYKNYYKYHDGRKVPNFVV